MEGLQTRTAQIRNLNDRFRSQLRGGQVMLTRGIVGRPDRPEILALVANFSAFTTDNDPHGEHDFGAFEHGSDTIFWKIDYYDQSLTAGSEDPADTAITRRVLTVMLAEEY